MKLGPMKRAELLEKCAELDIPITSPGNPDARPSDAELRERIAAKLATIPGAEQPEDETRDEKTGKIDSAKVDPSNTKSAHAALKAQRKVRIRLLRTERSGDAVPVAINGVQYRIQTGVDVDVPVSVVKVLQDATEWKFDPNNPGMPPREERSYPFDLVGNI